MIYKLELTYARLTMGSSRPPMRCEFQGYFRVVLAVRGNSIIRRTLGGG